MNASDKVGACGLAVSVTKFELRNVFDDDLGALVHIGWGSPVIDGIDGLNNNVKEVLSISFTISEWQVKAESLRPEGLKEGVTISEDVLVDVVCH